MYVIEDILTTTTQYGNEVVTNIRHMMYGRKEDRFKFNAISSRFVYRLTFNHTKHESMAKVVKVQEKV